MKFEKIDCGGGTAAVVSSDSQIIVDVDSALDLLMSAKYEAGTKYIAVDKKRPPDFSRRPHVPPATFHVQTNSTLI